MNTGSKNVRRCIVAATLAVGISGATLGLTQTAAQAAWFSKGIYNNHYACITDGMVYRLNGADNYQCLPRGNGRYELIVEYR
jgi:hypothetical protein